MQKYDNPKCTLYMLDTNDFIVDMEEPAFGLLAEIRKIDGYVCGKCGLKPKYSYLLGGNGRGFVIVTCLHHKDGENDTLYDVTSMMEEFDELDRQAMKGRVFVQSMN